MRTDYTGGVEPAEPFGIESSWQDGLWAVVVNGEVDLSTIGPLDDALQRLSGPIVLDLSGISFIDSAGLALLLRATRNRVTIGEVSPAVMRLFRLTGFEDALLRRPGEAF